MCDIEISTYFGRCRCCLEFGYLKNMWEKYKNDEELEIYGEMITQCYSISWQHLDIAEHDRICEPCVLRLRDACNFKKLVLSSQQQLTEEIPNDASTVKLEDIKREISNEYIIETVDVKENDSTSEIWENRTDDALYEHIEYLEDESPHSKTDAKELSTTCRETEQRTLKVPKKLPPSETNKRYHQYRANDFREANVRKKRMNRYEASQFYKVPRNTLTEKLKLEQDNVPDNEAKISVAKVKKKINGKMKNEKNAKEKTPSKYRKGLNKLDEEMDKHRDNIRSILQCSNATMLKAHTSGGYTCCFCPGKFPKPADLKRHNLDNHDDAATKAIHVKYVSDLTMKLDITGLRCIICGTKIPKLDEFMEHLKRIHSKPIHGDVKNYIVPFKFDTEKLECILCSKEFRYFKVLSEHMNEHYRNFECPVCNRAFINKQSLSTHSYRHQKNIGEFKCTSCPKIFDTRHKRSAHVRRIHRYEGKTRKCHVCNDKFTSSTQLQNHMVKAHGAEPLVFNCDACDKTYNNSRSLNDHKKRYHLMLRPHKCSYCDMGFYSRMELNTHIVTHTKTKAFQCDICDKRFGTKCCLSQHMRSHYGIKRHKCERCDIKYAAKSKWRLHMWKKHREMV